MDDDFKIFESMKAAGASAEQVYLQAARDGIDPITRIRLIRAVFSLTLGKAKEVVVRADVIGLPFCPARRETPNERPTC